MNDRTDDRADDRADDIAVRQITETERRPSADLLGRSLLRPVFTDEQWERFAPSFTVDRRFGAFAGDIPVGVASSFGTRMAVPGGTLLPAAAVNGVGVRADHTRRGVATRLMELQLRDCVRRGEVFATLHASEATIYGHFGYGVGTRARALTVRTQHAEPHPGVLAEGRVRLLDGKDKMSVPRELYPRILLANGPRPGTIERAPDWWSRSHDRRVGERDPYEVAVYRSDTGTDDGFATYRTMDEETPANPGGGAHIQVVDLQAADPKALAGLWRYLTGVDLIGTVLAVNQPLDQPVESLFTDSRACSVTATDDELWVRIVDVPAALAARGYGPGAPVNLEITDAMLPQNSGVYRVGPSGVDTTGTVAGLRMDVATLAMIYLGAWRPSALAGIGRIEVLDPAAVPLADTLFGTAQSPWCGTAF